MASILHPSSLYSYAPADDFSFLHHNRYVDTPTPFRKLRGEPASKSTGGSALAVDPAALPMSTMADPLAAVMHDPWHYNGYVAKASAPLYDDKDLSFCFLDLPLTSADSSRSSQTTFSDGSSPTIEPSVLLAHNNNNNNSNSANGDAEEFDESTATPSDGDDNSPITTTKNNNNNNNNKKRRCPSANANGDADAVDNQPKKRSRPTGPEAAAAAAPDADDPKRERFLEKNRAAAHRCRQKKKKWAVAIDDQCRELKARNTTLQLHIAALHDEAYGLKLLLLQHGDCGFAPIQAYIDRAAESVVKPLQTPQLQRQKQQNHHHQQ